MNDKEFCAEVHLEIHAVRRISGYKASEMDKKISKLVIDKFADSCRECKEVKKKIKDSPEKKGFLAKLGEAIE